MSRKLMLDTNMLSELLRDPYGRVAKKALDAGEMKSVPASSPQADCAAGASRGLFGARRGVDSLLANMEVMPFGEGDDEAYAKLRLALTRAATPWHANDLLIAAHANSIGATLVTSDRAFDHVGNHVRVVEWKR